MFGSEASGSGASREGYIERPRSARRIALGCVVIVLLVGGVFWRTLAIGGCFAMARFSSSPKTVAWSSVALAHLGPSALPALTRLIDRPDLQNWWSAREALALLHLQHPETDGAIHDLLGSQSVRVRAAAATILVREHDATGMPVATEALSSDDPDVRFFSALTIASEVRSDWFVRETQQSPQVFDRVLGALDRGCQDPRMFLEHWDFRGWSIEGVSKTIKDEAQAEYGRFVPPLPIRGR